MAPAILILSRHVALKWPSKSMSRFMRAFSLAVGYLLFDICSQQEATSLIQQKTGE
jgi:hypothetical protein